MSLIRILEQVRTKAARLVRGGITKLEPDRTELRDRPAPATDDPTN
jgi:hypothetical protein